MSRASNSSGGRLEGNPVVRYTLATGTTVNLGEEHEGKVLVLDTIFTVSTLNFKLPPAVGSGDVYTIVNNVAQTFGFVISLQNATDYMTGVVWALSQTTTDTDVFLTSATSDKVTIGKSDLTTGGAGGDKFIFTDYRTGYYLTEMITDGAGTLATPFSAT